MSLTSDLFSFVLVHSEQTPAIMLTVAVNRSFDVKFLQKQCVELSVDSSDRLRCQSHSGLLKYCCACLKFLTFLA